MRPGTIVRLPDGREGTVVYHGLDGYGVKLGRHALSPQDIVKIESCGLFTRMAPPDFNWVPEVMLSDDFTILWEPSKEEQPQGGKP